jgi:hypothetical protein
VRQKFLEGESPLEVRVPVEGQILVANGGTQGAVTLEVVKKPSAGQARWAKRRRASFIKGDSFVKKTHIGTRGVAPMGANHIGRRG